VGAGRATLDDGLGRDRAEGVDGLRDRPRSGRPRLLAPEQEAALKARIVAGPEYAKDGVTAFRGVDMRRILKEEFEVKAGLSSAHQLAHRPGPAWVEPRPQHPKSDPAAQAAFQQTSRPSSGGPAPACRTAPRSRSGPRAR
jgi:putative transposase